MNHMMISGIKSIIRIIACILIFIDKSLILPFAVMFGIAEVLGILEEVFDKRKEN